MTPIKTVPLAFLATALAIGVALYFNIFTAKPAALEPYPIAFENVSKDVYRQGFLWRVPGVPASGMLHRLVDVHVFLIKIGQDNVLVDVGAPGEEYKRILSAGLRESLKGGQLRLVILTHGHIDHVGALTSVVKEYPDVQVIFHEREAPFLTGNASYGDIPSENPLYKVSNFDVSSALPASRVLLIKGESGDISDARGPSGQKPAWVIPRGRVSFHHSPGHSPGHVSYLHESSNSLIAGDIFGNLGQPPKISLPPPAFTPNMTQARLSLIKLANLDFENAFCAHDRLVGISRKSLQEYTRSL